MYIYHRNSPETSEEILEDDIELEGEHSRPNRLNPFHIFAFVYITILVCGILIRIANQ